MKRNKRLPLSIPLSPFNVLTLLGVVVAEWRVVPPSVVGKVFAWTVLGSTLILVAPSVSGVAPSVPGVAPSVNGVAPSVLRVALSELRVALSELRVALSELRVALSELRVALS